MVGLRQALSHPTRSGTRLGGRRMPVAGRRSTFEGIHSPWGGEFPPSGRPGSRSKVIPNPIGITTRSRAERYTNAPDEPSCTSFRHSFPTPSSNTPRTRTPLRRTASGAALPDFLPRQPQPLRRGLREQPEDRLPHLRVPVRPRRALAHRHEVRADRIPGLTRAARRCPQRPWDDLKTRAGTRCANTPESGQAHCTARGAARLPHGRDRGVSPPVPVGSAPSTPRPGP